VISNVGPQYYHTLGYLKASPDGSKIAAANARFTGVNADNVTSDINLFNFNNNTGELSGSMTFDFPFNGINGNVPYGIEFSPNSQILYVSPSESPGQLTQFNLLAGSEAMIDESRITIYSSNTDGGALQIGPDGKIYHARWNEPYIGSIENPNVLGIGSNYNPTAVGLVNGTLSQGGLPAYYNSMFVSPQSSCDSTAVLYLTINTPTTSTITDSSCDSYTWNGSTYNASGTYTYTTANSNSCDSIATLNLTINSPTSSSTSEVSCEDFAWNGTTYSSSGEYTYATIDLNGCDSTATLDLTVSDLSITAELIEPNCYDSEDGAIDITYESNALPVEISWSNGLMFEDNLNIAAGEYSVTITDSNDCEQTETFTLTSPQELYLALNAIDASCDYTLDGMIESDVLGGTSPYQYSWNTGSTEETLTDVGTGEYSLTVIDDKDCEVSANATVYYLGEGCLEIPTVFTPNDDGYNDDWVINGIIDYPNCTMKIFNRWGQLLFESVGYTQTWNGTYDGDALPIADYYFILDLQDGTEARTGTITLKR